MCSSFLRCHPQPLSYFVGDLLPCCLSGLLVLWGVCGLGPWEGPLGLREVDERPGVACLLCEGGGGLKGGCDVTLLSPHRVIGASCSALGDAGELGVFPECEWGHKGVRDQFVALDLWITSPHPSQWDLPPSS